MKTIKATELKEWLDSAKEVQIIDVREPWEREVGFIQGSQHIVMNLLGEKLDQIRKDCVVVIQCRSGARSAAVTHHLEAQLGYTNVINLEGGITAWAELVDSNVEVA